jgi:hypothetical protein
MPPIFNQDLTHNNITKMSRKWSRTYGKFYGIFTRILGKAGGVTSKQVGTYSKKQQKNEKKKEP